MILVSDRPGAEDLPRFIGRERLSVCAIADAKNASDDIVAVDIDLENRKKRKYLKQAFCTMRPRRCLAVAVDFASQRDRVAARKLGATAMLSRPLTAGILHHFVAGLDPDYRSAPLEDAMTSAASVLAEAFEAHRRRGPLDHVEIRLAAAGISGAVAQWGAPLWLATIAANHDGVFRHCLSVAGIASAFGRRIGISQSGTTLLTASALLLDLGTARAPHHPGAPSLEPLYARLEHYPVQPCDYLGNRAELPVPLLDAIRHHHERLDGSGCGGDTTDRINAFSRVLGLCDLFVGLVGDITEDHGLPPEEALDILQVMARENRIDAAHVAVLKAAYDTGPVSDAMMAAE